MPKTKSKSRPARIRIPLSQEATKAIYDLADKYRVPVRDIVAEYVLDKVRDEASIKVLVAQHFAKLFESLEVSSDMINKH